MSQWRKITQPCGLSDSSPVPGLWGFIIYLWIGLDPAILHILSALTKSFLVSFNIWLYLSKVMFLLSSLPPDLALLRTQVSLPRPLLGLRLCCSCPFPSRIWKSRTCWSQTIWYKLRRTHHHNISCMGNLCAWSCLLMGHSECPLELPHLPCSAPGNNLDCDTDVYAITTNIQTPNRNPSLPHHLET